MSKADPNMPYGTRSGVSRAGKGMRNDAEISALKGFMLYEKKLQVIENPIDTPKTKNKRTLQTSRGPISYFGTTSSVTYEYESGASNEEDFDSEGDAEEVEQTDEDLDETILAGVDDLLARVHVTFNKEERCWYELEAPHCRNRRSPFILRSELDILDTVKNREIKEMFETLTEVASHYKDTLAREKALKEENTQLKAHLESNTNILLGNIGYRYESNAEFYDDIMADAPIV